MQLALSYKGPEPDRELVDWIRSGRVHGIVLFADNIVSVGRLADSVRKLKEISPQQLRIMIDEEGGRVRRLPHSLSPMPALSEYGKTGDACRAADDYGKVGRMLSGLGIDILLAPVLDIQTPRNAWLAERTFSAQPNKVAYMAQCVINAIQGTGIAACAKHFPGLGGVHDDLHLRQFIVDDDAPSIEQRDLVPFRAAIAAGVDSIMVAHAVYTHLDPTRPAVFSPIIIGQLLRRQLGFAGDVLSDDLAMGAIRESMPIEQAIQLTVQAGCNWLLVCNDRLLQRRAVAYVKQAGLSPCKKTVECH